MDKSCFNCKYFDQPSLEMKEFCWECLRREELYTRWERKPIIKADKIRAMSDEELSVFLCKVRYGDIPPWCDYKKCETISACDVCRLDWLKQEAE